MTSDRRFRSGQPALAAEKFCERFPFQKLHREEGDVVTRAIFSGRGMAFNVESTAHIGVSDAAGELNFAPEAGEHLRV